MPKVTKKLQRESSFFVQQVQPFPFRKVMAAPGERKFSPAAGSLGHQGGSRRSHAPLRARIERRLRARRPGSGRVCAGRVWKGQAWVGVNKPLPSPRAPPVASGGATRRVGTNGARRGAGARDPSGCLCPAKAPGARAGRAGRARPERRPPARRAVPSTAPLPTESLHPGSASLGTPLPGVHLRGLQPAARSRS